MIKILHLVPDEKFIDAVIFHFEQFHNIQNEFICHTTNKFKFIESGKVQKKTHSETEEILNRNYFDVVIFHSLYVYPVKKIKSIPRNIKCIWFAWGYDIYQNPIPLVKIHDLYGTLTSKYVNRNRRNAIYRCARYIRNYFNYIKTRRAILRFDYFSGILPLEYDLLNDKEFINAKSVVFSYPFKDDFIKAEFIEDTVAISSNNILVGNSASTTNNHTEIFELLSHTELHNRKVIVPINYGDLDYQKYVIQQGQKYISSSFTPLVEYMLLKDFTEIVNSCSVCVFAHKRQQALGTIILSLWNGAKVFLPKESIVYKYFIQLGVTLFCIEDDLDRELNNDSFLSFENVKKNRQIMCENWSYKSIHHKIDEIINELS